MGGMKIMHIYNRYIRKLFVCLLSLSLFVNAAIMVYADNSDNNTDSDLSGELTVLVNKSVDEMQPYAELFQKRYPGASINYIYLENYDQQASELIASGNYGDVLFIPGSVSSSEFENYFEVLGSMSDMSKLYNYIEQAKTNGTSVYGIPSSAYVSGFIYNKRVFEQAGITEIPQTPEEFLTALSCIRDYTDAIPFYTNYISDWALNVWEYFPYIEMTGNSDYKSNVFVNIKDPFINNSTHKTVYKLLYDIVSQGLCEEIGTGDWEASKSQLNNGEIGCIAIGSWALQQFKDAGVNGDNVAFMPFPYSINGVQYASITTDYCYAINKNSSNKELARAYIDFMLNESGYALNSNTISIVKTDPFPESYNAFNDVVLLPNAGASLENKGKFDILSSGLNLNDGVEQKRIIDAACGKTDENLDDILNDWNTRWESSRTADMITSDSNIFTNEYVVNEQYEVTFSDLEKEYIKENPILKVGYLRQFAPFQYVTDGKFTGISASFCQLISDMSGISFQYLPYDSYKDLCAALDKGEINIIAGIETASNLTDNIQLSKSYANYMLTIVKNNSTDMNNMEQKNVAVLKNSALNYFNNLENNVSADSLPLSLKYVNQLDADYTIMNYYSANYYIREQDCSNVTIVPLNTESGLHLGFSKNADTRLIAICNKCIYGIPDGQMKLLLLENMDPPAQTINLRTLIELYPLQFIMGISGVFMLIVLTLVWIFKEKHKSAKKHELDAKRYQILAKLANEYMFEYSYTDNYLSFDDKFTENFGFGGNVKLDNYKNDIPELNFFLQQLEEIKTNNCLNEKTFVFPHDDNNGVWYKLITAKIYDDKETPIQIIGKLVNFQAEMNKRLEILDKAERDPLTGLLNREGFQSIYKRFSKEQTGGSYLLGVLDLDNFKSVNDHLGHAGGDEALKLLADQLTVIIDTHGITSRYGGDEFVIYIPDVTSVTTVENLLAQLVLSMYRTITYEEKEHTLSISLGAVLVPYDTTYEDAFPKADKVLYEVKSLGKNNYKIENLT